MGMIHTDWLVCHGFDGKKAVIISFPGTYSSSHGSGDTIKEAFNAASEEAYRFIDKGIVVLKFKE